MENLKKKSKEMRLELGTISSIAVGRPISPEDINPFRELNDVEYAKYREEAQHLFRFQSIIQLFSIVQLNLSDYQTLLEEYFNEYIKRTPMSYPQIDDMILNVNRHILNYLSAARTFIDHSHRDLSEVYGKNSDRYLNFKNECSSAYDNYFSYRFLEELRNYAQHCGMPVSALRFHTEDTDEGYTHDSLSVVIRRDEILGGHNWKASIREEIERLPPEFDISPYLFEKMKCLKKINYAIFKGDLPRLTESAEYVRQLVSPTTSLPGIACIIKTGWDFNARDGDLIIVEMIPVHLADTIIKGTLSSV